MISGGNLLGDFLDLAFQFLPVDRLGHVPQESRGQALRDVFLHPETTQRDRGKRTCRLELLHQLMATAVGQTKIADQKVERLTGAVALRRSGESERFLKGHGAGDAVT